MDWFAKAYALLHDPPHKALWFEGYRIYSKSSHEEEARQMLAVMLMATPLGGGAPPTGDALARRVDLADRAAASFDRWALPKPDGGYWVRAKALHNPFNVKYSLEIKRPDPKAFEAAVLDYVHDVNDVLRGAPSERDAYMLLYASAELAWALRGLPALPADTRAPTHTVFDHLYATASVMNWVGEGGRLRGCLLEVDIPGIQRIIGSARKAGDYSAGSLLVSLAIWLTAWQYMRAHGPDALLSPTPRFNPLFYLQLEREIGGGGKALGLYSRFAAEMLGFRELAEARREGEAGSLVRFLVSRASVMPGTAYLMLPDCGEAEKAPDYFDRALAAIRDAVLGSEDVDPPLPIPLGVDRGSPIHKLAEEALRQMPMPYLQFRYRYVSVDEAREEARSLAELLSRGGPPGAFDEERLLFYAARRLLHRRPAVPRAPSWFAKGGAPRFRKLYDGPWIHSTLDPDQPASLRFGQSPDSLDYDEGTKKALEERLGRGWDPRELRRVFKPKEALGPVDVLKRALYYAASGRRLPSVEEVALRWYAQRKSWMEGCPDDVRKAVEEIVDGGDAEEVIGPSPAPDRALERCRPPGERAPPMSFMYAIISADGDFITRLNRGCVRGLGPDVERAVDGILPKEAEGDAERWRRNREAVAGALRSAQALRDAECGDAAQEFGDVAFVIPSPSYYAALSASLMVTALKDVKTVLEHGGEAVYAGGDDLLAFAARPAALEVVRETREGYHGEEGFHRLRGYALPAPAAYGRSYSVRLAHSITDFMSVEVGAAHEAVEKAKEAVKGKDALAVSTSTGHMGVAKTSSVGSVMGIVAALLEGGLSRNLPYDMEREFAGEGAEERDARRRAEEALLRHIAERNARGDGKAAVEALITLHKEMWESLKLKEAQDKQKRAQDEPKKTCDDLRIEGPWQNAAELLKALREFL
jgi:CRISPR-associated protein Cmr2